MVVLCILDVYKSIGKYQTNPILNCTTFDRKFDITNMIKLIRTARPMAKMVCVTSAMFLKSHKSVVWKRSTSLKPYNVHALWNLCVQNRTKQEKEEQTMMMTFQDITTSYRQNLYALSTLANSNQARVSL